MDKIKKIEQAIAENDIKTIQKYRKEMFEFASNQAKICVSKDNDIKAVIASTFGSIYSNIDANKNTGYESLKEKVLNEIAEQYNLKIYRDINEVKVNDVLLVCMNKQNAAYDVLSVSENTVDIRKSVIGLPQPSDITRFSKKSKNFILGISLSDKKEDDLFFFFVFDNH